MPIPRTSSRTELQALRSLIAEVELVVSADVPGGKARTLELLRSALALTDDLIGEAKLAPPVMLGSKGGNTTSQRFGTEHYRKPAEGEARYSPPEIADVEVVPVIGNPDR